MDWMDGHGFFWMMVTDFYFKDTAGFMRGTRMNGWDGWSRIFLDDGHGFFG